MNNFQFQFLVSLAAFCFLLCLEATDFGCLNHEGEFVDWWVIYKEFNGERYVYLDSQLDGIPLGLSNSREITSKLSPITRTVNSAGFSQIKQAAHDPCYLAWNDQPKQNENFPTSIGHAKVNTKDIMFFVPYFAILFFRDFWD